MNMEQTTTRLSEARDITLKMRELEQEIINLNNERRALIRDIWRNDNVSQRLIANALGITNQTIWNEIHRKDGAE
jgi:IS30 family transposase